MQISACEPNPPVNTSYLQFIVADVQDTVFTDMMDYGATNSFVYSKVIQQLNATTVDIPAMRVAWLMVHMLIVPLLFPIILSCMETCNHAPVECPKLYMQAVMFCVIACQI